MDQPKKIYRRADLPLADFLMSHQSRLRDEFMQGFDTLDSAVASDWSRGTLADRTELPRKLTDYMVQTRGKGNIEAWQGRVLKYTNEFNPHQQEFREERQEFRERYPTAYGLIEELGHEHVPIVNYSILAPHSHINRHTGVENRHGRYLRYHIPLIIPEGRCYFEAADEETDWSDIWAFNNQWVHSAHNETDHYRLVFLIDITRERSGVEPGIGWDDYDYWDDPTLPLSVSE